MFVVGVGGIEAEAVMLGQPISMVLPEVIGYRLQGTPNKFITSTDIVLTVTKVTGYAVPRLPLFYKWTSLLDKSV